MKKIKKEVKSKVTAKTEKPLSITSPKAKTRDISTKKKLRSNFIRSRKLSGHRKFTYLPREGKIIGGLNLSESEYRIFTYYLSSDSKLFLGRNLSRYRDFIYSATEGILKRFFPDELSKFKKNWDKIWKKIKQPGSKKKWMRALRRSPNPSVHEKALYYPRKMFSIEVAIAKTFADLFLALITLSSDRHDGEPISIAKIVKRYMQEDNLPGFLYPFMHREILSAIENEKSSKLNIKAHKKNTMPEEKKEYIVFSHEFCNGLTLSKTEYKDYYQGLSNQKENFLFVIDEINDEFYFRGKLFKDIPQTSKDALKFILTSKETDNIPFKNIYKKVSGIELKRYYKSKLNIVRKWFDDLKTKLDDDLIDLFFETAFGEYVISVKTSIKFCLIERVESPAMQDAGDIKNEKEEYLIYSHEYEENVHNALFREVAELRKLIPMEKSKRFDIFFDEEMGEVTIRGKTKFFTKNQVSDNIKIQKLLFLFLLNVGNRVMFSQIKKIVFREEEHEVTDSLVCQLKKRLCDFTEQTIYPFIKFSTDARGGGKEYIIAEQDDNYTVFKYCMITKGKTLFEVKKQKSLVRLLQDQVEENVELTVPIELKTDVLVPQEKEKNSESLEEESYKFLSQKKEKQEYIMFSNECRTGKELSKNAYSRIKDKLEPIKLDCFLFINEITGEFYVYGKDQVVSDIPKAYLKLLIKNPGYTLNYDIIYERVTGKKLEETLEKGEENYPDTVQTVYKWNSLLLSKIDNRLGSCILPVRGKGYKICFGKKKQYYLFDFLTD